MGASICWSLRCVKTIAYNVSDANVYKTKWLEKLGVDRDGALIIACL